MTSVVKFYKASEYEFPPLSNGIDKLFWEISTKGHPESSIFDNKLPDMKIPYLFMSQGYGYVSTIVYGVEDDYNKVLDYLYDLGESEFKITGSTIMKKETINVWKELDPFKKVFEKQLIEYHEQAN